MSVSPPSRPASTVASGLTARGSAATGSRQSSNAQGERAAAVLHRGGALQQIDVVALPPRAGQVRLEVAACGICAADTGTVRDADPTAGFSVIPGHEIAGTIAEVGEHVHGWQVGDRVAVGWFGGSCGHCSACRRGDLVQCPQRQVPGLAYPGGWATTITVPAAALARIPEALSLTEAAPFGCAGVTTFNALDQAGLRAGSTVAVIGIGGLGHLAVQFAAAMGHQVIAVGRGQGKAAAATDLGAADYVDTQSQDVGAHLQARGGADLVICTASATRALDGALAALAPRGELVIAGFDAARLQVPLGVLVSRSLRLRGHLTGTPVQTEAAMRFAVQNAVRPVVQTRPLSQAAQALAEQQAGAVRFRMVLSTDS